MKQIKVSDITIKKSFEKTGVQLSFKEKIELAKIIDSLGVDVIELPKIEDAQGDALLIKSIAASLDHATLAVNAGIYKADIDQTWEALKDAKHARIQIVVPVSPARMEYDYHKKAAEMKELSKDAVAYAKTLCEDVEFIANDATRADADFLQGIMQDAIDAGATTVSVSDTAGVMLPDEMSAFLEDLAQSIPSIADDTVSFGVSCSNAMHLADACAVSAIKNGVDEIKAGTYPVGKVSVEGLSKILSLKADECGAKTGIRMTELQRALAQVATIFEESGNHKSQPTFAKNTSDETSIEINDESSFDDVVAATKTLGYDLDEGDKVKVWNAFKKIAKSKAVGKKELEAIIATEAEQVPETYKLESYIITTGNVTDVIAHIKLEADGELLDGISLGDGPIDAAFLAIEKIVGRHFELDDFQISAITRGREAMGQTLVKLRDRGKVYSGVGTSTDILGAAIKAYINALNKIVYEENN